jgi:hypothetical protein
MDLDGPVPHLGSTSPMVGMSGGMTPYASSSPMGGALSPMVVGGGGSVSPMVGVSPEWVVAVPSSPCGRRLPSSSPAQSVRSPGGCWLPMHHGGPLVYSAAASHISAMPLWRRFVSRECAYGKLRHQVGRRRCRSAKLPLSGMYLELYAFATFL